METDFLAFLAAIIIVVVAAKAGGYVSVRLGQPSVLGELAVGLLLGPTLLNVFNVWPVFSDATFIGETLDLLAEIGVILLMFLAGLELELSELLRSGRVAALAGTLGVVLPLLLGAGTAMLFNNSFDEAVLIGLALSATSVSISAQTLIDLGVLRSRVGLALLGAAVFDDILVILLLAVAAFVVGLGETTGVASIVITLTRMIVYLVSATAIGLWLLPPLLRRVSALPISQGVTTFALVVCLSYAWAAQSLGGMAAITGAFLAGLLLARTPQAGEMMSGMFALGYSFFIPIFLVNIGLSANLRAIGGGDWVFAIVITLVAVVSKIAGSGFGAILGGFERRDALRLGVGMVSRGEVGLIVASVGLEEGLIAVDNFSILVFMVIIATLITPPMLRAAYAQEIKEASIPVD